MERFDELTATYIIIKILMETGVYTITNIVNGKMYIGSTTRTFSKRREEHFDSLVRGCHPSRKLQNSVNKHGVENFIFEVLDECLPEYCESTEQFWLNMLHTSNDKYGYNIRPIAHTNRGCKRTLEMKTRASEIRKGWYKGDKNPFYGKKHSEGVMRKINENRNKTYASPEYKEKIKIIRKNVLVGNEKFVFQFSKTGEFISKYSSISDACRTLGKPNTGQISQCCKKLLKSAHGFYWRYDDGLTSIEEHSNDLIVNNKKIFANIRPVIQLTKEGEFVKEWPSISEATKQLEISNSGGVNRVCKGLLPHYCGFKWRYK